MNPFYDLGVKLAMQALGLTKAAKKIDAAGVGRSPVLRNATMSGVAGAQGAAPVKPLATQTTPQAKKTQNV